jgi:hypothetical protein
MVSVAGGLLVVGGVPAAGGVDDAGATPACARDSAVPGLAGKIDPLLGEVSDMVCAPAQVCSQRPSSL